MSEPTFNEKPYFTNEQLEQLSKDYKTVPVDAEGYATEPVYNGPVVRLDVLKLISDVRQARRGRYEAEDMLASIIRVLGPAMPYDMVIRIREILGKEWFGRE